jgi:hypothetical protein
MIVKKGKQIKINDIKEFNIIVGTVDNKSSKSLYFNITGWVETLDIEADNNLAIKELNRTIRKKTYEFLNKKLFNPNRFLIDFELKESGLSANRRSYMSCEITLFKINDFKIQNDIINDSLMNLISDLIENVFKDNKHFKFHKTKK